MQPIYVKNVKNTYFDCTIKKANAKFFLIIVALRTMFPGTVASITTGNGSIPLPVLRSTPKALQIHFTRSSPQNCALHNFCGSPLPKVSFAIGERDSGDREEFMIGNLTHRKNGFYSSKKVE